MALYELIVFKPGSDPEVRYTDRPFNVGQRFKLDLRPYVVTQTTSPRNPDAVQSFVCAAPTEAATLLRPLTTRHSTAARLVRRPRAAHSASRPPGD